MRDSPLKLRRLGKSAKHWGLGAFVQGLEGILSGVIKSAEHPDNVPSRSLQKQGATKRSPVRYDPYRKKPKRGPLSFGSSHMSKLLVGQKDMDLLQGV